MIKGTTSHIQGTYKAISIALHACNQTYLVCRDPSFFRWYSPDLSEPSDQYLHYFVFFAQLF